MGKMDMSRLSLTLMLVVGLGITGAVGQDYGNRHYNNGYGPQQAQGWPNQNNSQRYTTVTVTNRGQNGNRDEVVQQTVQCGSTYYDGYRNRTARC